MKKKPKHVYEDDEEDETTSEFISDFSMENGNLHWHGDLRHSRAIFRAMLNDKSIKRYLHSTNPIKRVKTASKLFPSYVSD